MSLAFKYNPETGRIESDDPEIYVEVIGLRREGTFEAVLHYESQRIGIRLESERSNNDRQMDWFIEDVGSPILRHDKDGNWGRYCGRRLFEDRKEAHEIIDIVMDAFLAYDGSSEPLKREMFVSVSPGFSSRLYSGKLTK